MLHPTRHALLRDRAAWRGTRIGLLPDAEGRLALATVPGPADGRALNVATPLPYACEPSGIALGPQGAVFVSDTAGGRVLFVDGSCDAHAWLPMGSGPRGIALAPWALLVACPDVHRVQHLARPALEPNTAFTAWAAPLALAVDSRGRVLVIDAATRQLHAVDEHGTADSAFDQAVQATAVLVDPIGVAVAGGDCVLVADRTARRVFVFQHDGTLLDAIDGPAGWVPAALAALGTRLYVADAATGAIHAFELDAPATWLGELPGWFGPVTALAVSDGGDLYVKPGLDACYFVLNAHAAVVTQGSLHAGPFDAGDGADWERVWIDAEVPTGASCRFEAASKPAVAPAPSALDWREIEGTDALLAPGGQPAAPGQRRHLWLRVTIAAGPAHSSVRLHQVRAATAAEDYLDHLPQTYRRHDQRSDGGEGCLSRLLKLLRTENAAIEEALDNMPRIADPQFAADADLAWLASWLALELPQIAAADERRALIARAVRLFERRGTPASIAEFVELHTGIRPAIVEGFDSRRVWMLGVSSRLDFDTQLPPLDPLGWVVPDATRGTGCCEEPADDGAAAAAGCCATTSVPSEQLLSEPTLGRLIVGEGGPLAPHQFGLPMYAEDAYRFCVLVDAYRVCDPGTLDEIHRIVDREKPAHTDYRVQLVDAELRIGMQARVSIDAIVGGPLPPWRLDTTARPVLMPSDNASRLADLVLDGGLTLT
ncbi:phage tail protein [Sphaerotilaceae bacterium SBD11-9]